jgi:hypothetical protein
MGTFSEHLLLELLVGAFLIGIAPYVQRWRDKRAIAKGQKHTQNVKQHYSRVMGYALDPHGLTQHLILQAMAVIGAAVNIVVGLTMIIVVGVGAGLPGFKSYFPISGDVVGLLIWVYGLVQLARITTGAVSLWAHIQGFDKYVGSVPAEFRNPELEHQVREKLKVQGAILV